MLARMEAFPIKLGLLSRFRTKKQQEETIKGLRSGTVDIVVGTHRLLSDDIKFHDLGLVIIDEEQRFGVKHKEKLKENFIGVDMLTLSATPIPRTLNMAMSGIRDLSTIEQPPIERQPVETFVLYGANFLPVVYCGVMSSGAGYTLQILGQKDLNPAIASLIMCLESVFSALGGWLLLGQNLSMRESAGCTLIFAAVVLSQLPFAELRRCKKGA